MVEPKPGDTVTLMSAGGGGYGDPFERPTDAVLRDVRAGFVSIDEAREDYGVVIDNGGLDKEATAELRREPRAEPSRFDLGPERNAWDRVFTDHRMMRLVDLLLAQPPALASRLRFFRTALPSLSRAKPMLTSNGHFTTK